jgi:hypothetical protein
MLRWLAALALALPLACGSAKPPAAAGAPKVDVDADPLALLPPSAVVVANVDAKALFEAPTIGPPIVALADKLVPLGADAGFDAKRDVDRILVGSYSESGRDVAAIVTGRFDVAKLASATKSKGGAPLTRATYAGIDTCSVGQGVYAVLTSKTVVAGDPDAVHKVLDRIHEGALARALPAWVLETVQTPGAEIAAAGDFESKPLAAVSVGMVKLPWLAGVTQVRALADVKPPGLSVTATLTYPTGEQASAAADGVRSLGTMLNLLGPLVGGLSVHDLAVEPKGDDVKSTFAVDDRTLEKLLSMAPRALPGMP